MVDPIVSKAVVKPVESASEQGAGSSAKTGESKFDQVRARLQDEQAAQVTIPPEVKQVSPQQRKILEGDLSKRLDASGTTTSAKQIFAVDMKRASAGVQNLTHRINSLPKTPAFEPFRKRLASLDQQFQSAGQMMQSLGGTKNPADLMKIQVQMYQLSENMELMSKAVEQVTSGVKSILQTQV